MPSNKKGHPEEWPIRSGESDHSTLCDLQVRPHPKSLVGTAPPRLPDPPKPLPSVRRYGRYGTVGPARATGYELRLSSGGASASIVRSGRHGSFESGLPQLRLEWEPTLVR